MAIVYIRTYQASPYVTQQSTNLPVFGGEKLGSVWAARHSGITSGVLFVESLIHKVMTDSGSGGQINANNLALLDNGIDYRDGKLYPSQNYRKVTHAPVTLAAPTDGTSPCAKALYRDVSVNQKLFGGYSWNEMVWSSTSNWGGAIAADTSASQAYTAGTLYKFSSGNKYPLSMYRCMAGFTGVIDTGYVQDPSTGNITDTSGNVYMVPHANGWNDDSTIRIIDGVGTFNNLAGVSCGYAQALPLSKRLD